MIGAIDIGGTKIALGLVDAQGYVLTSQKFPTAAYRESPTDGIAEIIARLRQCLDTAEGRMQGIGIGCTGPVDPRRGTLGKNAFLPGWQGVNLVQQLGEVFDVSVAIENDANAATLGEWAWGAGRGADPFLLVSVGTGIGVGLVVNGRLYQGVHGSHPEMGHHVIDPSGPACFCGARGCWESLASGQAMRNSSSERNWAQSHHPAGEANSVRQICALARQGDEFAIAVVKRAARYLAIGLANLVTLFSPETICLSGGLMQNSDLFWDEIERTVAASCGLVPHAEVKITLAAPGAQAGLVGAAQVWLSTFRQSTPAKGGFDA